MLTLTYKQYIYCVYIWKPQGFPLYDILNHYLVIYVFIICYSRELFSQFVSNLGFHYNEGSGFLSFYRPDVEGKDQTFTPTNFELVF